MNGKGKRTWPDGKYFEREFKDNLKDGPGKIVAKSGQYTEGTWKNNYRFGKFIIKDPKGKEVSYFFTEKDRYDDEDSKYDFNDKCNIF